MAGLPPRRVGEPSTARQAMAATMHFNMAATDSHCTGGPSEKPAPTCGAGGLPRRVPRQPLAREAPWNGSGIGWRGAHLAAAARAQVDPAGLTRELLRRWREQPAECGWRWLALGTGPGGGAGRGCSAAGRRTSGARRPGCAGAPSRGACWPSLGRLEYEHCVGAPSLFASRGEVHTRRPALQRAKGAAHRAAANRYRLALARHEGARPQGLGRYQKREIRGSKSQATLTFERFSGPPVSKTPGGLPISVLGSLRTAR
jgi:hypothetical protein